MIAKTIAIYFVNLEQKMKKLLKDPKAFEGPLNKLGWKESNFTDYEVQRDYLEKNNGIKDLKILKPEFISLIQIDDKK